mmetsp:Transcript_2675/g.8940  ORF Transcript_2675/g.8940 Transcript_2675/m.8940 type:complete len:276 (+) Transcript_2675:4632-5459(+)
MSSACFVSIDGSSACAIETNASCASPSRPTAPTPACASILATMRFLRCIDRETPGEPSPPQFGQSVPRPVRGVLGGPRSSCAIRRIDCRSSLMAAACSPDRADTSAAFHMRTDSASKAASPSSATSDQSSSSASTANASFCSDRAHSVADRKLEASLKKVGSRAACVPRSPSIASSTRGGGLACSTLARMLSSNWMLADCILAMTCSMVGVVKLTDSRTLATSSEPSTSSSTISQPVSGEKSSSASCGYCDSQDKSAPRSIMPIWISNTTPFFWA